MSGQVSQSESQVIYRRLCAVATRLLDIREEIDRLDALKVSLDLGNTLEPDTGGNLTKGQAVSLFAELVNYRSWFNNATVAATGTEGSNATGGRPSTRSFWRNRSSRVSHG